MTEEKRKEKILEKKKMNERKKQKKYENKQEAKMKNKLVINKKQTRKTDYTLWKILKKKKMKRKINEIIEKK